MSNLIKKTGTYAAVLTFSCMAMGIQAQQTGKLNPVNGPGSTYSHRTVQPLKNTRKLPVGLELMPRLELLPVLRDSVCLQDSSYDRSGGNGDFGIFLRKEGATAVLADIQGPGCIYRIWSANPAGTLRIYLDGSTTPEIEGSMLAFFKGEIPPYSKPFNNLISGGGTSFFPITFAKSCRVEVQDPGAMYYHVEYQRYPDSSKVTTFSKKAVSAEQISRAADFWKISDLPAISAPSTSVAGPAEPFAVEPGKSHAFEIFPGGRIELLQAQVINSNRYDLKKLILKITWDGADKPAIEAPIGEFFGLAMADTPGRSKPLASGVQIGSAPNTKTYSFASYWPMPFQHKAHIEVYNAGDKVQQVLIRPTLNSKPKTSDEGYFHASFTRQTTRSGEPFHILATTGHGHYVGTHVDMQGDHGIGFLEGDEQFWVDDEAFPSIHGTGSEDFYSGGWYFLEGPFQQPVHGCLYKSDSQSRISAYRYQLLDCVPFRNKLTVNIEHGGTNDYPGADYSCVAYWYLDRPVHDGGEIDPAWLTPPHFQISGAIEAEILKWSGGGAQVVSDLELPVETSAGQAVALTGSVSATVSVPKAGIYTLAIDQVVQSPNPSKASSWLDGDTTVSFPLGIGKTSEGILSSEKILRLKPGEHILHIAIPDGEKLVLDRIRLVPAPKNEHLLDAEELLSPQQITQIPGLTRTDGDVRASGFSLLDWQPASDGASLTLPIHLEKSQPLAISLGILDKINGMKVQALWDGKPAGSELELAEMERDGIWEARVGWLGETTSGDHQLTLKVIAPPAAGAHLTLDYLYLLNSRYPNAYEGESLPILGAKDGEVTTQDMNPFGPQWSNNAQFWLLGQKAGAEATLELPFLHEGTYQASAYFTTAKDYGQVQLLIDGNPIGGVTDLYTEQVKYKGQTDLGKVILTRGKHKLTVRVVGKNSLSQGYLAGLDAIILTPEKP